MDPETFASARAGRLQAADEELEGFVDDALNRYIAGDPDWDEDLITAASVLWLETYNAEAPNGNGERKLEAYQNRLAEALGRTSEPEFEVTDGQIQRVTYWLSGYTVNDATMAGTQGRGGKFKRWVSHHDDVVRSSHENLDGTVVAAGATFSVEGYHLHYPGEPVGPPEIWINCRCVLMPAAREGEAMSANTYRIGPDEPLEVDNPDIITSDDIRGGGGTPRGAATYATGATDPSGGRGIVPPYISDRIDPTDIAVEPPDEEDLVDDDPEEGEELITEIPVHGVLAPEGVSTGDGREFAMGALSTRDLPIPLRYETVGTHGGTTSDVVTVGRIDEAWRDDATDSWRFVGAVVLTKPFAQDVIDGIVDGTVRGVSIDGDDAEVEVQMVENEEDLLAQLLNPDKTVFSKMRVAGLTIVPIPAFQQAYIALGAEFQEDMTSEQQAEQMAALQACGCMQQEADLTEVTGDDATAALAEFREFPKAERDKAADSGAAMPDGSYPIKDCTDLQNAIQAIGRAKDPDATKAHIRKRKSALGCPDVELPENWSLSPTHSPVTDPHAEGKLASREPVLLRDALDEVFAPGTHDGPGWITHPIPTARIRRYWVSGQGSAKIRWGAPGDFNRCRNQLAKYVQNPDWLAGLCANMHKEALGFWPAQHHGSQVITASASPLLSPVARLVPPAREVYPSEWFDNPGLERAVALRVEKESRRIFGYVAEWGSCHVGVGGFCQEVPPNSSGYAYFLKGVVDTSLGERFVGTLTWGGHASRLARLAAATEFYDKPDAVRAYVNVGEDSHGIWFAGVVAPWCTDEDIDAIRGIGAVSGDWREYRGQLELIGVPIVNTPGFPLRQLAASAGRQTVMIGAGALRPEPIIAAASSVALDPDTVAGIARTAVAEYRHQEKVAARAEPIRAKTRERRLEVARARTNRR